MVEKNQASPDQPPEDASGEIPPINHKGDPNEMSFLEHLEELRWRILKALAAIVLFAVLAFIKSRWPENIRRRQTEMSRRYEAQREN